MQFMVTNAEPKVMKKLKFSVDMIISLEHFTVGRHH
jgi:hypothetical protein